jgi:hypothetical protein
MEHYNEEIQFCFYCKDPIKKDEPYVVKDNEVYHSFCWEQINRFYDPFGEDE